MFATNRFYFKILSDSLNETTIKQQKTSISDYMIGCLFQSYKNMWNKRTDAKGKRLSKVVSSKTCYSHVYSLTFHDNVFRCQKKTQRSKHLSFRHTCLVEEV